MIIYKDLFTGDELLSDVFRMKLIDNVLYEVKGKFMTETTDIGEEIYGGNASAEAVDDDAAGGSSQSGIDVCLRHRLVETTVKDKKEYGKLIKDYMKRVLAKLEGDNLQEFKGNIEPTVKKILGEFKEYQFFVGESLSEDGMMVLVKYDGETPMLYFFKHGLIAEKV